MDININVAIIITILPPPRFSASLTIGNLHIYITMVINIEHISGTIPCLIIGTFTLKGAFYFL